MDSNFPKTMAFVVSKRRINVWWYYKINVDIVCDMAYMHATIVGLGINKKITESKNVYFTAE